MSEFPAVRMRRLRRTAGMRRLVREARLAPAQLVWPLFLKLEGVVTPVPSMPGVFQHPLSQAGELARRAVDLGVGGVLLFGIPDHKDEVGSGAYDERGVIQQAVRAMKDGAPDLVVITDVCLCEYTSHGHCGVVRDGEVDNDASLELLAKTAVSQASAGADMVAPSDMMDGRVAAIRRALDEAGLTHVPIMSYAAKYASAFYGPFREAAGSAPQFGDRRGYQMDPGNADEALREIALDLAEGADIVMVKPGMPYLDIVRRAKERFGGPLAVYQVSGEYAMLKFAAQSGALDGERAMLEALLAIRRAGGDIIITYAAEEVAGKLPAGGADA
ncbi:MAG: porphobilinogen synthase [Gemmatimonadales bacterium]|nr:porphobilinogen synthase [Gemmatimonadales bacterium]NIN12846.1 porphobilinogen synthase [Gemmatimonadales bacterium]NIN51024.1 porphobilinogen synthase [Gemmatimonadales bacterium]NIP08488.1 porphobilinogen synthase [Gemmatimonadales bacterium]NIR02528.1 porphobilinogen synthase [Gemmatimonadales bacterium]